MLPREMVAFTRRIIGALLLSALLLHGVPSLSQTLPIQYGYDELGRLVIVVDQNGNAAVYNYDAVGNLLSIQRIDVAQIAEPVAITYFTPAQGRQGTTVSIFGKGFSATPSQNTVSFNGGLATVTAATTNRLVVTVPAAAMTGPITVTTPQGSATSAGSFRLIGPLTLTPSQASLSVGSSLQFTVTGPGGFTPPVDWSVNGIVGGNSAVGTISATGLYSAPVFLPQPMTVTVAAADQADAAISAAALTTVVANGTTLFAESSEVSVIFPQNRVVLGSVGAAASASIMPTASRTASASVTAWVGGSAAATAVALPVSASLSPVVTNVSPASILLGASEVAVTLTGAGFDAEMSVAALLGSTADPDVTASMSSVSPDGTQASLLVTVRATAATGARVLQITGPNGTSTAVNTGTNTLTVQ